MRDVLTIGCFDDLRAVHVRFLEEAARGASLTVLLRDDSAAREALGRPPRFPLEERRYFLESLRFVGKVEVVGKGASARGRAGAAILAFPGADCADFPEADRVSAGSLSACAEAGLESLVLPASRLAGFSYAPPPLDRAPPAGLRKAIATGTFDWLHSGHVRFFEEAANMGELTVVVGHDANIRLLKGEGHPLIPEAERLYMVAAIRHVARALVSTGSGWLDAEPEIEGLRPDCYVVNADGDKEEKRRYCEGRGIEYIVLAREPKAGLPRRSSTDLRGF